MSIARIAAPGQRHTPSAATSVPTLPRDLCGGLDDTPASTLDRDSLLAHLGRDVLHGAKSRNFSHAYIKRQDGTTVPRMYRTDSDELGKCEYVMLTHPQHAAVVVIDIDRPGTAGGHPANLADEVKDTLHRMSARNIGPAWVGINPQSGKAQAIWLIDPAYADTTGKSPAMTLLAATTDALGALLGADSHFSHRFSRSPFYTGKSPTAYRWYRQHNRVMRLGDLIKQVRDLAGVAQYQAAPKQRYLSGRDLINAAKARREQAQAFKALAQEVEAEVAGSLEQYDPELIDGVRILWITPGVAARDETAFRHALKTGHRMRQQGQRLTDAALIDAYEHAYNVAHAHGAAGRDNEMPPARDRQTMARRVRGYVTQSKHGDHTRAYGATASTAAERKALATMGRRGGQKAAKRWETDPHGDYAQNEREKLAKANQRRNVQKKVTARQIANYFDDTFIQTGQYPSIPEAMKEFSVSRPTVSRALKAANIQLPRGRRYTGN